MNPYRKQHTDTYSNENGKKEENKFLHAIRPDMTSTETVQGAKISARILEAQNPRMVRKIK